MTSDVMSLPGSMVIFRFPLNVTYFAVFASISLASFASAMNTDLMSTGSLLCTLESFSWSCVPPFETWIICLIARLDSDEAGMSLGPVNSIAVAHVASHTDVGEFFCCAEIVIDIAAVSSKIVNFLISY